MSPIAASGSTFRGPLRIHVIEDPAELVRLYPAWRSLACGSGPCGPFVQPEWVMPWWRAFGKSGKLHFVTAWRDDRLVGALPLMLGAVRRYGLSVRRLGALANDHCPRVELLVADDADGVVDAIWRHIADNEALWDIFELPRLLSTSPTLQRFSKLAQCDGFHFGHWQAEACPFIETRTDWGNYLVQRSANFRKEIRRKQQRLSQQGKLSLEIVSNPADLPTAIEDGLDIEADGWKGREGTAMKSSADVLHFYRNLASRMAERQHLRLHFLRVDDQRVAFDFSIEFEHRLYSLKSGFRDSHSKSSPGLVLLSLMLQHYMLSGLSEIDLLGEEDVFKRRWTNTTRSHDWFICSGRSSKGRAMHGIKFRMIPQVRKIKSRLLNFAKVQT